MTDDFYDAYFNMRRQFYEESKKRAERKVRVKEETMIIGGQEFPRKCPDDCPGHNEPFMQGGLCHRCPIFNCTPGSAGFILVEPEEYRSDWARYWKEWFDNGMKGKPYLPLRQRGVTNEEDPIPVEYTIVTKDQK